MRICQYDNCPMPVFGTDKNTRKGYCKSHQYLRTDLDRRTPYQKAMDSAEVINKDEMDKWFNERRKEMTGRCVICGGKTEKYNDKTFKRSIAHLLPKRKNQFPSVATDVNNWVELCFFGNSHHTNFDNNILTLNDIKENYPKAWNIIMEKFLKILPNIATNEKRNIPSILLNEIQTNRQINDTNLPTKQGCPTTYERSD